MIDYKPMLATGKKVLDPYLSDLWACEVKFDGWRLLAHYQDDLVKVIAGRNGASYTGQLPLIEEALRALPNDTLVDGELIAVDGWGGVQGAMTRKEPHKIDNLQLVMFDILRVGGTDAGNAPYDARREVLRALEGSYDLGPRLVVSESQTPSHELIDAILAAGAEGVVLKRRASVYQHKRSCDWVKIKPQETEDAVVIGFEPGKSSFTGLVGALKIRLPNGQETSCSGFDMRLRHDITNNPEKWLGAIIEIKHMGRQESGKVRHPVYHRRRTDLEHKENQQ